MNTESNHHIQSYTFLILCMALIIYTCVQFSNLFDKIDSVENLSLENTERIETLDLENQQLRTIIRNAEKITINHIEEIQDLNFRIKMLSSEVLDYRIELDGVSHEDCNSKIEELWEEIERLK